MPEEWLEVAYINFDKAILHGRVIEGKDKFGVRQEREIEQVLTGPQQDTLADLNLQHEIERAKLLRSFVTLGDQP